jgi:hypothetical protein
VRSPRDQRPYNVAYYAADRDEEIERVKTRRNRAVEVLRKLRQVPCADCGNVFPPYVMDFDHREPSAKQFWILQRAGSVSAARLAAEIAKCDIVCANCHRVRTYARALGLREVRLAGGWHPRRESGLRREQTDLLQRLREGPCADCRHACPFYVMEFDHRSPASKSFELTRMVGRVSTHELLQEAAKCDVVCSNCHRERTYRRRIARIE